ncbi:MAG TPA: NADH-quinone oxidoreductase subunit C [Planctomycetota bacterium]|nr:NADH-quinone oxidoreductase subunit C [Planctomycetota bacterium]
MDDSKIVEKLTAAMPDAVTGSGSHAGQHWVETERGSTAAVLRLLRDDPDFSFDCLMDLTAVDWLNQGMTERYCVVYTLYSFRDNVYFRVKAWVPEEDPVIDTASDLWKSAPWAEREVYDLYGIEFEGHPDLKRLVLPEYYTGHPLRKDYPLTGAGERDNFPKYNRETGA